MIMQFTLTCPECSHSWEFEQNVRAVQPLARACPQGCRNMVLFPKWARKFVAVMAPARVGLHEERFSERYYHPPLVESL